MKKFMLFIAAATMAIVFSAFTSKPAPPETVWFRDNGTGSWISQTLQACYPGPVQECYVMTLGYGQEQIFKTNSTALPFTSE